MGFLQRKKGKTLITVSIFGLSQNTKLNYQIMIKICNKQNKDDKGISIRCGNDNFFKILIYNIQLPNRNEVSKICF